VHHQLDGVTSISLDESSELSSVQQLDDPFGRGGKFENRLDGDDAVRTDDMFCAIIIFQANSVGEFLHNVPADAMASVVVNDASKEWARHAVLRLLGWFIWRGSRGWLRGRLRCPGR